MNPYIVDEQEMIWFNELEAEISLHVESDEQWPPWNGVICRIREIKDGCGISWHVSVEGSWPILWARGRMLRSGSCKHWWHTYR